MVSILGIDVILRQYGSSYGLTEARLVCLCKYICDTCGGNFFDFYKRDIKRINYVETIKFLTEESKYREPILRFNDSETQVVWSNEKIWMEALIFACNMIITDETNYALTMKQYDKQFKEKQEKENEINE